MHHLSLRPEGKTLFLCIVAGCQDLVRFFALRRIKPHTPLRLCGPPVNSFEFQPCGRTPPGGLLIVLTAALKGSILQHLVIIVYSVDYQGI